LLHVFFVVVVVVAYSVWFFSLFSLVAGQSVQGDMLISPRIVCGSTVCHLAHLVVHVFPITWDLVSGGTGALLVSPFNVEWGCYAWARGVEESEYCLFLVVFPGRCISSVSPRFYFRKHAFCFLPLVAILESPGSLVF
jgi:hypothetical protein